MEQHVQQEEQAMLETAKTLGDDRLRALGALMELGNGSRRVVTKVRAR